jgi:hypothetical protein
MGIKFLCPHGHKLNVKSFLAGKKGVCPECGERFIVPLMSTPNQRTMSIGQSQHFGPGHLPQDDEADDGPPIPGTPSVPVSPAATAASPTNPLANAYPLPGVVPGVVPSLLPGAVPGVVPGTFPSAVPGTLPGTIPGALPAATTAPVPTFANSPMFGAAPTFGSAPTFAAVPGTIPGAIPGAIPSAIPGAMAAVVPVSAPIDPLAEAPQAKWYVRPPAGGQFGPADAVLMRQWIGEGRVSADSMVWREGWADWKKAGGLLPGIAGAATATASTGASGSGTGPLLKGPDSGLAGSVGVSRTLAVTTSAKPVVDTRADLPRPKSSHWGLVFVLLMAIVAAGMMVVLVYVIRSN